MVSPEIRRGISGVGKAMREVRLLDNRSTTVSGGTMTRADLGVVAHSGRGARLRGAAPGRVGVGGDGATAMLWNMLRGHGGWK